MGKLVMSDSLLDKMRHYKDIVLDDKLQSKVMKAGSRYCWRKNYEPFFSRGGTQYVYTRPKRFNSYQDTETGDKTVLRVGDIRVCWL